MAVTLRELGSLRGFGHSGIMTLANIGNFGGSNWCLRLWWFGSLGDIWLWGGGCVSEGQGLWYDLSNCLRLCVVS